MKKLILGCLSGLVIAQTSHATHAAFYVGTNASRSLWHVTQQMALDGSKVTDTALYNQDWGQRQQVFNAEILGGIKASNGTVFGAVEGWYNPSTFQIDSVSNDIVFNSGISNRWGIRLLAGVQHNEMTLYSILGLGQTKLTKNTYFPSSGIYARGTNPGVTLASTNGSSKEVTRTVGIGMSVVFTKDWDISIEYQHQSADSNNNLYDSAITYLNSIGQQTTQASANIFNIGLKYHFKPFMI